jgi:hypothetical protein
VKLMLENDNYFPRFDDPLFALIVSGIVQSTSQSKHRLAAAKAEVFGMLQQPISTKKKEKRSKAPAAGAYLAHAEALLEAGCTVEVAESSLALTHAMFQGPFSMPEPCRREKELKAALPSAAAAAAAPADSNPLHTAFFEPGAGARIPASTPLSNIAYPAPAAMSSLAVATSLGIVPPLNGIAAADRASYKTVYPQTQSRDPSRVLHRVIFQSPFSLDQMGAGDCVITLPPEATQLPKPAPPTKGGHGGKGKVGKGKATSIGYIPRQVSLQSLPRPRGVLVTYDEEGFEWLPRDNYFLIEQVWTALPALVKRDLLRISPLDVKALAERSRLWLSYRELLRSFDRFHHLGSIQGAQLINPPSIASWYTVVGTWVPVVWVPQSPLASDALDPEDVDPLASGGVQVVLDDFWVYEGAFEYLDGFEKGECEAKNPGNELPLKRCGKTKAAVRKGGAPENVSCRADSKSGARPEEGHSVAFAELVSALEWPEDDAVTVGRDIEDGMVRKETAYDSKAGFAPIAAGLAGALTPWLSHCAAVQTWRTEHMSTCVFLNVEAFAHFWGPEDQAKETVPPGLSGRAAAVAEAEAAEKKIRRLTSMECTCLPNRSSGDFGLASETNHIYSRSESVVRAQFSMLLLREVAARVVAYCSAVLAIADRERIAQSLLEELVDEEALGLLTKTGSGKGGKGADKSKGKGAPSAAAPSLAPAPIQASPSDSESDSDEEKEREAERIRSDRLEHEERKAAERARREEEERVMLQKALQEEERKAAEKAALTRKQQEKAQKDKEEEAKRAKEKAQKDKDEEARRTKERAQKDKEDEAKRKAAASAAAAAAAAAAIAEESSSDELDAETLRRIDERVRAKRDRKHVDVRNPVWKSMPCHFFRKGKCVASPEECFYSHGDDDRRVVHEKALAAAGVDVRTGRPVQGAVLSPDWMYLPGVVADIAASAIAQREKQVARDAVRTAKLAAASTTQASPAAPGKPAWGKASASGAVAAPPVPASAPAAKPLSKAASSTAAAKPVAKADAAKDKVALTSQTQTSPPPLPASLFPPAVDTGKASESALAAANGTAAELKPSSADFDLASPSFGRDILASLGLAGSSTASTDALGAHANQAGSSSLNGFGSGLRAASALPASLLTSTKPSGLAAEGMSSTSILPTSLLQPHSLQVQGATAGANLLSSLDPSLFNLSSSFPTASTGHLDGFGASSVLSSLGSASGLLDSIQSLSSLGAPPSAAISSSAAAALPASLTNPGRLPPPGIAPPNSLRAPSGNAAATGSALDATLASLLNGGMGTLGEIGGVSGLPASLLSAGAGLGSLSGSASSMSTQQQQILVQRSQLLQQQQRILEQQRLLLEYQLRQLDLQQLPQQSQPAAAPAASGPSFAGGAASLGSTDFLSSLGLASSGWNSDSLNQGAVDNGLGTLGNLQQWGSDNF